MASASWAGGDNPSIEACAVHVGRAGRATIRTGYTIPSSGPGMQHWYHPCPVWALTVIKWFGPRVESYSQSVSETAQGRGLSQRYDDIGSWTRNFLRYDDTGHSVCPDPLPPHRLARGLCYSAGSYKRRQVNSITGS